MREDDNQGAASERAVKMRFGRGEHGARVRGWERGTKGVSFSTGLLTLTWGEVSSVVSIWLTCFRIFLTCPGFWIIFPNSSWLRARSSEISATPHAAKASTYCSIWSDNRKDSTSVSNWTHPRTHTHTLTLTQADTRAQARVRRRATQIATAAVITTSPRRRKLGECGAFEVYIPIVQISCL